MRIIKKILLTIVLFSVCSTANATTWYRCTSGGTGQWTNTSSWTSVMADQGTCVASLGAPAAGDTAILNSSSGNTTMNTSSTAAFMDMTGYTGTLTFSSAQILTLTTGANLNSVISSTSTVGIIAVSGGTVTLLATVTGTLIPQLRITGSSTMIASTFSWPGGLNLDGGSAITVTLNNGGATWNNTGACQTNTSATTLNKTITGDTLTCNNGLTMNTNITGTATVILTGGTWSGSGIMETSNFNLNGNITVSGAVDFGVGVINYLSGTISQTPGITGSALNITTPSTINTGGMTWNILSVIGNNTLTYQSNLNATMMIVDRNTAQTFSTAGYNTNIGNLFSQGSSFGESLIFSAGSLVNITNSLHLCNNLPDDDLVTVATSVKSGTVGSPIFINYTGPLVNEASCNVTYTDVYSVGQLIYNYSYPSTVSTAVTAALIRTYGIRNFNATNLRHPTSYNGA